MACRRYTLASVDDLLAGLEGAARAERADAGLAERVGQERDVDQGVDAGTDREAAAELDLRQFEDGGDFLQNEDRDIRTFFQGGEVTAAHAGQTGQAGLSQAFADAGFAYGFAEHVSNLKVTNYG